MGDNIAGGFVATASITKEFIVKDEKAYIRMVNEISKMSVRTVKTAKPSNINRENKLLKQLSLTLHCHIRLL